MDQKLNRKVCFARLETANQTGAVDGRAKGPYSDRDDQANVATRMLGSTPHFVSHLFLCTFSKGNCLSEVSSGKPILFHMLQLGKLDRQRDLEANWAPTFELCNARFQSWGKRRKL